MNRRIVTGAACAAAVITVAALATGADHADAPAAMAEPAADITDVYAWMSPEADKLNLVLNWHHMAPESALFSDAVAYTLHVESSAACGAPSTDTKIVCRFYSTDGKGIECWAGDDYVSGDPSDTSGLMSEKGKLRVFSGRRDDPFFFELTGFRETVKAVIAAAPSLTFDTQGCPAVDPATSQALVSQLQHGSEGAAASNTFAGSKVLSLVVQVDKGLVTPGGDVVGVWAATHAMQ